MSAGVAGRPLVGGDLSMVVLARSSGNGLGDLLAQGITAQLEPVGIVDDAIQDRVGEGGIADQVVPAIDRDLAGDQRGAPPVALTTISSRSRRCSGPSGSKPQSSRISSLTPAMARMSRG